jgi:hypothetical protein
MWAILPFSDDVVLGQAINIGKSPMKSY